MNDQMNTDKQNPDIAGEIHINKSDLDDRAGDQIIMSECASDEIGRRCASRPLDDTDVYAACRAGLCGSDSGSSTA